MHIKNKFLAINSIFILVSTTIIGNILHEVAHFIMASYFDLQPELHHNYVNYMSDNATKLQNAVIAGIGPILSLTLGVTSLFIAIRILKLSLLKLFMLWLGIGGLINFFGYILIAPIATDGDTGKVFKYWNVPIWASASIAIVSFLIIVVVLKNLAKEFRFYKNRDTFDQEVNGRQLFVYPILSSIVLITILNLPVVHWVSLLPTIFLPMAYFNPWRRYRKLELNDADLKIDHISKPLIILTISSIILFRILV